METRIAIIGAGTLGIALATGFVDAGRLKPGNITLMRRRIHLLESMKEKGYRISGNSTDAVRDAELIIFAVEPQQMDTVLGTLTDSINPGQHTVISVVTGVPIAEIRKFVGDEVSVLRAMPNTAIAVRESMTCIATDSTDNNKLELVISLFKSVGSVIRISEEQMNAATALGSCGIAFFLQAIRAASQGGIEIGFDASEALKIAAQTARGAASLLIKTGSHPAAEIDKVTTPRGCTIAGLNQMEHEGFASAMIKGIKTSADKAAELYPNKNQ